jgi:predicted ATP-dependent serine protease
VIVGENGTGKSTAVRQVLSSLSTPKGAIYINSPESPRRFSIQLSKLIGFQSEVDISGGITRWFERSKKEEKSIDLSTEPEYTFIKIQDSLLEASIKFKSKHGCPMVLVIDSADVLAKKDPLPFWSFFKILPRIVLIWELCGSYSF